jgi:hypothetical protein
MSPMWAPTSCVIRSRIRSRHAAASPAVSPSSFPLRYLPPSGVSHHLNAPYYPPATVVTSLPRIIGQSRSFVSIHR